MKETVESKGNESRTFGNVEEEPVIEFRFEGRSSVVGTGRTSTGTGRKVTGEGRKMAGDDGKERMMIGGVGECVLVVIQA